MPTLANILDQLDDGKLFALLLISIFAVFFGVWIVVHYAHEIVHTRQRERTRREIAAYVAEGSISPDDASKLLAAGSDGDAIEKLLAQVAEGSIESADAERLIALLKVGVKPA
ncbi:MAG: hypothetical protein RBS39_09145 [Phycisphaerales bacterium]|jgi:hypothetical protein|nr:hypothetical protein [Phycisphaerales bacterium]